MILLDTCALIWWTLFPEELSEAALQACQRGAREGAAISSISIWEVGIETRRKRLELAMSLASYVQAIKEHGIEIIPVDEVIWMENLALDWNHRDPADRTIVATARMRKLPLVTADKRIRRFYKSAIW